MALRFRSSASGRAVDAIVNENAKSAESSIHKAMVGARLTDTTKDEDGRQTLGIEGKAGGRTRLDPLYAFVHGVVRWLRLGCAGRAAVRWEGVWLATVAGKWSFLRPAPQLSASTPFCVTGPDVGAPSTSG